MKIGIIAEFPLPIVYGGLEIQCLRTFESLKKIGVDVKLIDYHSREKFDIIHIFGNPPSIYEICYHIKKTKKIVISAVCGAKKISMLRKLVYEGLSKYAAIIREQTNYSRVKYAFNSSDQVICLNKLEENYLNRFYSIPKSKISIISNGVEEVFFKSTPDAFRNKYSISNYVLFTGNIIKRKNPLRIAKALQKMKMKGVFIGNEVNTEKDYAEDFRQVISKSNDLLWINGLQHDDPLFASAYAGAELFCLPSNGETQSLSALEAMASGKPLILGDLPYAYQEPFLNSVKCNPDDEKSIIECIDKILSNKERYSVSLPKTYTWESVAINIKNIYERI